ncbi:MAG: hypothetical protein AAFY29_22740 [Pseudomonadota bacterium]
MFTEALDTIKDRIDARLPDVDVDTHPGRFTEDELAKIVRKKRALRVAIEEIPGLNVQGDGVRDAEIQFAAHVICGDDRGEDRHELALSITEQVLAILAYARWDDQEKFKPVPPATIAANNLYSGELAGKAIAWWAITWTQGVHNKE